MFHVCQRISLAFRPFILSARVASIFRFLFFLPSLPQYPRASFHSLFLPNAQSRSIEQLSGNPRSIQQVREAARETIKLEAMQRANERDTQMMGNASTPSSAASVTSQLHLQRQGSGRRLIRTGSSGSDRDRRSSRGGSDGRASPLLGTGGSGNGSSQSLNSSASFRNRKRPSINTFGGTESGMGGGGGVLEGEEINGRTSPTALEGSPMAKHLQVFEEIREVRHLFTKKEGILNSIDIFFLSLSSIFLHFIFFYFSFVSFNFYVLPSFNLHHGLCIIPLLFPFLFSLFVSNTFFFFCRS